MILSELDQLDIHDLEFVIMHIDDLTHINAQSDS